jgi:phosphoglucomutase
MYKDEYLRWLNTVTEDYLQKELKDIKDNEERIKDRFFLNLEFGTAGLRGVLGAGTNRMNVYTVAKATQGLANFLKNKKNMASVAISYDSRNRSQQFGRVAAKVLAANGIKVYIYRQLTPVPMLSYAVRRLGTDAGIMITASHNLAKYNGYKVYGDDGCQMTSESADKVLAEINNIDIFTGIKSGNFDELMGEEKINWVPAEVIDGYYSWCLSQMMHRDIFEKSPLNLVYTPLNGAGNIPVRYVLTKAGLKDITVVKQQEHPDGNFPTCPYPNPEVKQAMQLGLDLAKEKNADILVATDPDCDRVGIAVREDEDYIMLTGNQVGILLLDYIAATRKEMGTMPKDPVIVKSIVTTPLADIVAKDAGIETINVLTGFKYIGSTIKKLEEEGKKNSFLLGFEESYGYLVGTAVRDKDAVVATLLICEMAAYYRYKGSSVYNRLREIYREFGYYLNKVDSYTFEGLAGLDKMKGIMASFRKTPPKSIGGMGVEAFEDYETLKHTVEATGEKTDIHLPNANILIYYLQGGHQVIIRPSGTEPKIKVYYSVRSASEAEAEKIKEKIRKDLEITLKI